MVVYIRLFLILNAFYTDAYKILVFSPTVSMSHMIENGRIADALARDGNDVTVLEIFYFVEPGALKSVNVAKHLPVYFDVAGRDKTLEQLDLFDDSLLVDVWQSIIFQTEMNKIQFAFLDQRKDVLEQLIAEKFDVIVYEQYTWLPLVLAELLNISSRIFISSCPLSEHQTMLTGVPLEFSYVPAVFGPYTDEMSVTERFFNIFRGLSFASTIYYDWNYRVKKDLEDRYGKDFPMPWEIAKKADLVAINTDEFIDYPRPLPPNVIHIGGLGMDHHFTQALTSPYKEIMERGRKGVVLFSLGSIVETNKLPKAYMKNVFEAIKKFEDYCFMVKINNKDGYSKKLAKKIKNVYLVDWAPQPPILAHPRLHLFVTHGGYNSILEAAYSGVPILGIGMLWDQPRNVKVVERNGWGLTLDKLSLKYTSIEFEQKMRCLLTVVKYKESALRIQRILKTKPQTGEQRLLSYIRFLEQNGGHLPELKSIAPHLSVIVYHNIDVIFYVVVATTVTVGTLAFIIKKLISLFLSFSWTKKQKIA